jgi:hypothetical protein
MRSENTKKKDKNIFSKIYNSLEKGYNGFSDWLTKKGIPLNKLNHFLEKKGIPPFALIGAILIIILIILFLLIFGLGKIELTANFRDSSSQQIDGVFLSIRDADGVDVYTVSNAINSGQKLKVPLSLGKSYTLIVSKDEYDSINKTFIPTSKKEEINFVFTKPTSFGQLIVRPIDSSTNKIIPEVKGTIRYESSGSDIENIVISNGNFDLVFDAPLNTRFQITLEADGYQSSVFDYQITQETETKEHMLDFDMASFEGKESNVTITVVNNQGENVDDATIQIYDTFDNKLLDVSRSVLGKALFKVSSGKTIRIVVTADNYKKYDSEEEDKTLRIIKPEETFPVVLKLGGNSLSVQVIDKDQLLPIENAKVNLYNSNNSLIDGNYTSYDGYVKFDNLDSNLNYIVSACYENYFCEQQKVNLDSSQIQLHLEKITSNNSRPLGIHVFDEYSNPLPDTEIEILVIKEGALLNTGIENLELDLTGYLSVPLRTNQTYEVRGYYREVMASDSVTISPTVDNKVVLLIYRSKIVKLDLEKEGFPLTDGHLLVKSKTGEILYDGNVDGTTVEFDTFGYKDLILEYTDKDGKKTTMPLVVGDDFEGVKTLDLTEIQKEAVEGYPIIDFVGVEDLSGNKTSFISTGVDYYLVFDILFSKDTKSGGAHIRVGDDFETDSENMSYGITGFKADATNFRYSLTYTPYPGPGAQEIDLLNIGSSDQQNKWLNLEWESLNELGNKQIKVKVKAIDDSINKAIVNYRAWANFDLNVLRDPQDGDLLNNRSSVVKAGLYANTKKIEIDIFDKPADCVGDVCVSHKFIDSETNEYTDDFFAVKGNLYALESTIFTLKNKTLLLTSQTTSTNPILTLVTTSSGALNFPTNVNYETFIQTEIAESGINVTAGTPVKVYTYFYAKDLGSTYIENVLSDDTTKIETKKSFDVYSQKKMNVIMNPLEIADYDTPITFDISDSETNDPIENAKIKITNLQKENLGVILPSPKNGLFGKYMVDQKFNNNKIIFEISSHGYQPETREIIIADQTLLGAPDKITLNLGQTSSTGFVDFTLINKYSQPITDIRSEIRYIDNVDTLSLNLETPNEINSSGSINSRMIATVDAKLQFNSAKAVLVIYGRIGNKQIAKKIDVLVLKGAVKSDCLLIKPELLDSYVGFQAGSENTITLSIKNNCEKPIVATPKVKREGVIPSKENIDVSVPGFSLASGEELEYEIVVKNKEDTKMLKKHAFNIFWDNEFYEFEKTKLNVEIVDVSKSMQITPQTQAIPLAQHLDEFPAETHAVFVLKNTGNITLRDIQISNHTNRISANVQDSIYPPSVEVLEPDETVNVVIQYKGKINLATIDDLYYKVSAYAPGIKNRVETSFQTYLWISPPSCIKINQKSLDYALEINKPKERSITITNECSEPVMITDIDKKGNLYADAFGATAVEFYPSTYSQILPMGASANYVLKLTANQYEFPRLKKPIRFVGRTQSGATVSSESILVTTEVIVQDQETIRDSEQTYSQSVPICESLSGEDARNINLNFPIVSTTCDGDTGFCDAVGAANLILKRAQDLQARIITDSSQIKNQTQNSSCAPQAYNNGYCEISDILKNTKTTEFYLYLQNDAINVDLLRDLLIKDQSTNKKFSKINRHLVLENSGFMTPSDVSITGGRLLYDGKLRGCGKYKVTIDGFVAANHELILPERTTIYIMIEEMEKPESCSKSAENFILFLPHDKELKQASNYGTWLTMITGKKEFGEKIATDVFNDAKRYAFNLERSNQFNIINLFTGNISEKEDAIAKIYFRTKQDSLQKTPEITEILINSGYGAVDGENKVIFDEKVVGNISKVIQGIMNQDLADVCISENKDYLLLLSFKESVSGTLELTAKDKVNNIRLEPEKVCKTLELSSTINETVLVNNEESTLNVTYNYQGKEHDALSVSLQPEKTVDFNVCVVPSLESLTSEISNKLKITATSKFRESSAMGLRAKTLELDLISFALTPLELFETINKEVQNNSVSGSELDTFEFFALVDWDDTYSPRDTETQCEILKKFIEKNFKAQNFFVIKDWCPDLEISSAASSVAKSKARDNTFKFFGSCFKSCSMCSAAGDTLLAIVSGGMTIPLALKNIVLDCGIFTCGMPAGVYYASQVTGNDWGLLNALKTGLAGLGKGFSTAFEWVEGVMSDIGDLFGLGTNGAQELTIDQIEGAIEEEEDPFLESMNALKGGSVLGVASAGADQAGYTKILRSTTSPYMAAGSSKIISNFDLPTSGISAIPTTNITIPGTSGGSTLYTPAINPSYSLSEAALKSQVKGGWIESLKGESGGLKNIFQPDPSDADDLARIMGQVNNVDDFMALSADDSYDLAKILSKTFNNPAADPSVGNPAYFSNPQNAGRGTPDVKRLVDRLLQKSGHTSIAAEAGDVASTVTRAISVDDAQKGLTQLDDALKTVSDDIAKLDKEISKIENYATRNKSANTNLDKLTKTKADLLDAQNTLKNARNGVDDAIKTGTTTVNGQKVVSISDDLTKNIDDVIQKTSNLKSSKVNWKFGFRKWGGMAKGIACGIVGNMYGLSALKEDGEIGNLEHSIVQSTDSDNITSFSKNKFYYILVYRTKNSAGKESYILKISLESPINDKADNVVYKKANNKITEENIKRSLTNLGAVEYDKSEISTEEMVEEMLAEEIERAQREANNLSSVNGGLDLDNESISSLDLEEIQKEGYLQKKDLIQKYTGCSFPGQCADFSESWGERMCSRFSVEAAKKIYNLSYILNHSWFMGSSNKVVWRAGQNTESYKEHLVPGVLININIPGSKYSQPSHIVLYVGKDQQGRDLFLHQSVDKSSYQYLDSYVSAGRSIHSILIPSSGYTQYSAVTSYNSPKYA